MKILDILKTQFNSLKLYVYGFLIIVFIALICTVKILINKNKRLFADNSRIEANNFQLMSDNRQQTNLYLTEKELSWSLKQERDSLAKALKIKPKQIEKIIYIDNSIYDTVRVNVPVIVTGKNKWKIEDSGECFKWSANAFLLQDSLKIERTNFEDYNKTTQVFYHKAPHIWFLRIGKWTNYVQINAKCGDVKIETFNFIK